MGRRRWGHQPAVAAVAGLLTSAWPYGGRSAIQAFGSCSHLPGSILTPPVAWLVQWGAAFRLAGDAEQRRQTWHYLEVWRGRAGGAAGGEGGAPAHRTARRVARCLAARAS